VEEIHAFDYSIPVLVEQRTVPMAPGICSEPIGLVAMRQALLLLLCADLTDRYRLSLWLTRARHAGNRLPLGFDLDTGGIEELGALLRAGHQVLSPIPQ
jgi:hypothetical protein